MISYFKRFILFLCLICIFFVIYREHSTLSCITTVTGVFELSAEQVASPNIQIVSKGLNSIVFFDYNWNIENSYTTIYAYAQYFQNQLMVSIVHSTAVDELRSTGSNAAIVEVFLPENITSHDIKRIIVKSRDARQGQVRKKFFID